MVCIAAFIILALIGIFVLILSIFFPKIGKSYVKLLKKSWGCLWKKVRLQKCETGFKDDVKNTLLSRIVIKHPKWVKPLSAVIEILSVIVVVIAIWSIVIAIKSMLALWALGTCNVAKPAACSLGAEMCSIDSEEPTGLFESFTGWFTEWGEIFEAIPDKFHSYDVESYNFSYVAEKSNSDRPIAVDIFDPGCSVCLASYVNQQKSGFFDEYEVRLVPFPIRDTNGGYKFQNSEVIARYTFAVEQLKEGSAIKIINRIFTQKSEDGIIYQSLFNIEYSREDAISMLEKWIVEDGMKPEELARLREVAFSDEITQKLDKNQDIVENVLHVKGIPTMIYNNKKHTGLFKQ